MKQSQSMIIVCMLSIVHMVYAQPMYAQSVCDQSVYKKAVCNQTDGSLDNTFGVSGKVVTAVSSLGNEFDRATGVVVLPSGKIVVAGYIFDLSGTFVDFALVGYTSYGAIDNSFGSNGNGRVITDLATVLDPEGPASVDRAYAIAIQKDCNNCVLECALDCTPNGSLDGNKNNKLVVVGESDALDIGGVTSIAVVRYTSKGILDSSFGVDGNGVVILPLGVNIGDARASAVAIQNDGKIVVAGHADNLVSGNIMFCIVRLNCDGTIDTSFGCQGVVLVDIEVHSFSFARAVKIQKDGNIVVAGNVRNGPQSQFALTRLTVDGKLDKTFGKQGIVTTDFSGTNISSDTAYALVLIEDGTHECNSLKIVAVGSSLSGLPGNTNDFALACYTHNGTLDASFGPAGTGLVTTTNFVSNFNYYDQAFAAALLSGCDKKGKIIAVGSTGPGGFFTQFALACYTDDGWLDTDFGINGKVVTDFPLIEDGAMAVAVQSNGNLVVAGVTGSSVDLLSRFAVARYTMCLSCCI